MPPNADDLISKADALYAAGSCDEAVDLLAHACAEGGSETGALTRLIELLVDSERYERALVMMDNAVLADASARLLLLRAICFEALGDPAAAETIVQELLEKNERHAEALALKGRLALRSKQYAVAETVLEAAITCDRGCGIAWYGLACLQRQRGETQAAFDLLKKAFLCSPECRTIAIDFHESALAALALAPAEAAMREALGGRWMHRRLRFLLIDLLLRQNRFAEAMTEIESVLADFGVDERLLAAALKVRERLGPMRIPREAGRRGSVSLCMIVRNEKKHLARCLRSAKPVVDDIVVVDTGSMDGSKDIAWAFGARVYDFQWTDDFSKARNFGLSKAAGDWILVLDADEVLSAGDYPRFRQALEMYTNRPAALRIRTRNYSNQVNTVGFRLNRGEFPEEAGIGWYPSDKVRLFSNDARIRFEYPVHELVEPSLKKLKTVIQDCPVAVHHYGMLKELHALEKTRRYRQLGRRKLKAASGDAAALKELAIQSARTGNPSQALGFWRRFLKLQPRSAEAYLNMGAVCLDEGRLAEAAEFAQTAFCLDPTLKEAQFNLAYSMLLMGRAGEAQTLLEGLSREQPDYLAGQFLLCVAYACQQETARAEAIFKKIKALPIGDYVGEAFLDMAKRLRVAFRWDDARRTLEAALDFGCENPELRTSLESLGAAARTS